jgi:hypothetical protein
MVAPWNDVLNQMPYVSWMYAYDPTSATLRISPSSDTQTLFGSNLRFDKFDFYVNAQTHPNEIRWATKAKEDINGTGLILVGSRTVQVKNELQPPVVAADLNVNRILKSKAKDFLEYHDTDNLKELFVFLYTKQAEARFTAGQWAMDIHSFTTLKPNEADILSVKENERPPLIALESKATTSTEPVIAPVHLRGTDYLCSTSWIKRPNIYIWICTR